jgi:prepilin-type N-terminal cleavage/methylation domain-containing protein
MNLRNRHGFTLLELLIAISLSVVILIILFAAMRLGYKSEAKGTERSEQTQKVRLISDRIAWLLRGTYPFYLNTVDEQKLFFEGKSDRAGFVTTSIDDRGQGPEDRGGLKWVSIFTDKEGLKVREKVYFLKDVFDDSGGKVYLLDPDITKIEFEYLDFPEGEKQGTWVSEWDPEDKETLPAAVKVLMTIEKDGKKIEFPEMIVRFTAQRKTEG